MFNFFDYTPFVVIIGDIKGSKKLINRNAVQKQLRELLGAINQTFQATVASDFRITLGDEFQGLLYCGKPVAHILDRIEREMFPVKIRFGIGVGEITTDIRSSTTEIDGPAYNLARDMIDMLRASETEKMEPKTNVKIEIQGNTKARFSKVLNTYFSLLSIMKASWTARQVEIINAYSACNGTQTDAAKQLNIHQSNVQRALSVTHYYAYQNALETITELMSDIKEYEHV